MEHTGRLDWRKVEHAVAEELIQAGYEVKEREPSAPGGDLLIGGLFSTMVDVKSRNLKKRKRGERPEDLRIFFGPEASLERHRKEAAAAGAVSVVIVGVVHDGERIVAAGALDADDFERRVRAVRDGEECRVLQTVQISSMHPVDALFPGVSMPAPSSLRGVAA